MKNGFPYWKYSIPNAEDMFITLKTQHITTIIEKNIIIVIRRYPEDYIVCDHLSNHFTEQIRITCSFGNYDSPKVVYEKVKNDINYKELDMLHRREYIYSLTKECNTFNVSYCSYILQDLLKDKITEAKVLDPSMGWGDRLIAALANNVNTYHGYDPNKKLHLPYSKIIKLFNINKNKYKHLAIPFEDAVLPKNFYNLALTSPPYYDLESYSKDNTQSNVKNETYTDWVNSFYRPYIIKMIEAVKEGGYIAIYIENVISNNIKYGLLDLTYDFINKYKPHITFYKKIGLKIGNKVRYIHIWQKIRSIELSI